MSDVETVARKLSDGQRRTLKIMSGEFKKPPRGHAYIAQTMATGFRLTEWEYVMPEFKGSRRFRLTPPLALLSAPT